MILLGIAELAVAGIAVVAVPGLHVRSNTFLVPPPVVVLIPVAACKEPLDWQFARRNMRRP